LTVPLDHTHYTFSIKFQKIKKTVKSRNCSRCSCQQRSLGFIKQPLTDDADNGRDIYQEACHAVKTNTLVCTSFGFVAGNKLTQ